MSRPLFQPVRNLGTVSATGRLADAESRFSDGARPLDSPHAPATIASPYQNANRRMKNLAGKNDGSALRFGRKHPKEDST